MMVKQMRRYWMLVIVALSLVLAACQTPLASTPTETPVSVEEEVGDGGLDFIARDLEGGDIPFSSLRGNVVLINFWASWCPPCQEEMPLLQTYYEEHAEEDFILLGLNVSDQPDTIQEIIDTFGLTFPVWRDPLGDIMAGMNVRGLPTSIVVDETGQPVLGWIGPFDEASLEEHITPLISAP